VAPLVYLVFLRLHVRTVCHELLGGAADRPLPRDLEPHRLRRPADRDDRDLLLSGFIIHANGHRVKTGLKKVKYFWPAG